MTNNPIPGHSGSRWEPVPTSDDTAPAAPSAGERGARRRRRSVLAFLVTLLTLGTASAGIAWARAEDPTDVDPAPGTSGAPFPGGDSGRGPGSDGGRAFGHHGPDRELGPRGDDGTSGDQASTQPGQTT